MPDILSAGFVTEMSETMTNMYRLGWDERNGGNISCLLDEDEVSLYLDTDKVIREIPLEFSCAALAGRFFIVTGTGKYFKNAQKDPEDCLGVIRISNDGGSAGLLWGYNGGSVTSELSTHLMSHIARLDVDAGNRVILHCHPVNTLAMTIVHEVDDKKLSRALWGMCSECIIVFPDGVGILPWMVCGNASIGEATAEKMKDFRIVCWCLHGIYGAGKDLDEAFGLVETVEKAAQIYILTHGMAHKNSITDAQLVELAEAYGVNCRRDFLDL